MKYTPFGEFYKILRIKNHENLSDASKLLGVSPAFISSVECGKRPVPEEWFEIISAKYSLSATEQLNLKDAIDSSQTIVKLGLLNASLQQRKVAVAFQRSFDHVDEETANELLKILEKVKK